MAYVLTESESGDVWCSSEKSLFSAMARRGGRQEERFGGSRQENVDHIDDFCVVSGGRRSTERKEEQRCATVTEANLLWSNSSVVDVFNKIVKGSLVYETSVLRTFKNCSYTTHQYTTHHTPLISTSLIIHHSSYTTHHTPLIIHTSSYTTHHTPLIIRHSSYTTHHTPLNIHHSSIHH